MAWAILLTHVHTSRAFEQFANFVVGRLGEVLVPNAHGLKGFGGLRADDLVYVLPKLIAGLRRRDGNRHGDTLRTLDF